MKTYQSVTASLKGLPTPGRVSCVCLAALLPVAWGAVPVEAAFVTPNSGPLVISDDFEAPVDGGNGYAIGQSPVEAGPWTGTANTTPTAGNDNHAISIAAGNGGQVGQIVGKYGAPAILDYVNPRNSAQDVFIDFDIKPGVNTVSVNRTGDKKTLDLVDSGGFNRVLQLGISGNDAAENPNRFYIRPNDQQPGAQSTFYGDAVDGQRFIRVSLALDYIAPQSWTYQLWLDGQEVTAGPVAFTTTTGAAKANRARFSVVWQDSAVTQLDNFTWRNDAFDRPIPEPVGAGVVIGGAMFMISRPRSRKAS